MAGTTALKIQDFDDPEYDPYTASAKIAGTGTVGDIFPELRKLREAGAVQELDLRVHFGTMPDQGLIDRKKFSVFGYNEVNEVLTDTSRFSNVIYEKSLGVSFGRPITVMDPPEHRGYRILFQNAFTPRMITAWGDTIIPESIGRVLDTIVKKGKADIENEFALIFPFTFICELLRLPQEHRKTFQKLAFSQTTVRFDPDHGIEGGSKLRDYLIQLLDERRKNPLGDDDLITTLANTKIEGDVLPEEILISFLRQLMNAGGDTSYHGFSTIVAALLRHPDQLEAVRNDRNLIPQAIEEGLRWEPPIMILDRTPKKKLEFGGFKMAPGDHIGVILSSANRDETVYVDPDKFDIYRKKVRHFSFGGGPHVCIGQHLARLELQKALNLVLDRLSNLRLDQDHPVPQVYGVTTRKPKEVRVLWDV
jgi:cytochrome P450